MDPNYTPFLRKAMPKELPAKKSEAIVFLRNAAEHQESYTQEIYLEGRRGQVVDREYEDQKSAQLLNALADLEDRSRSGEILWSEPTPGAFETIAALRRRGLVVVIVTNSDGHAEENLRDCGIVDVPVIDSTVVGSDKPDVRIFEAALARAGAGIRATDVVHVGDTLAADVAGARAAGITPIHFDPRRACRAPDHRHVTSLAGIWRHIAPANRRQT